MIVLAWLNYSVTEASKTFLSSLDTNGASAICGTASGGVLQSVLRSGAGAAYDKGVRCWGAVL